MVAAHLSGAALRGGALDRQPPYQPGHDVSPASPCGRLVGAHAEGVESQDAGDQHGRPEAANGDERRHQGSGPRGGRRGADGRPPREDPQRRAGRPLRRRARPPWSRRCCWPPARSRGPAGRRTARRSATTTRPRSGSSARSALSVAPLGTTGSRSTCSTPPATPTSSASCGPGCAPPTPRCSWSPPPTASTPTTVRSGRSAPRSACRARSWSPSSTQPRADFDETVAVCQRVFGDDGRAAALPAAARRRRRASAGLVGLLSRHGLRLLRRLPAERAADPEHLRAHRGRAQRADRGRSSPSPRTRP